RLWTGEYAKLTDRYVKAGKVASGMMLGNLLGDLEQGGKGPEDFRQANKAFLEALGHYKPDGSYDWVREAADAYPECFREELLVIAGGKDVDPLFAKLEAELKARGVTIPRPDARQRRDREFPTGAPPKPGK